LTSLSLLPCWLHPTSANRLVASESPISGQSYSPIASVTSGTPTDSNFLPFQLGVRQADQASSLGHVPSSCRVASLGFRAFSLKSQASQLACPALITTLHVGLDRTRWTHTQQWICCVPCIVLVTCEVTQNCFQMHEWYPNSKDSQLFTTNILTVAENHQTADAALRREQLTSM
jgi:hypothetical protein